MSNYVFFIQNWFEDDEHYYFSLRKILKKEAKTFESLADIRGHIYNQFGENRLFAAKLNKQGNDLDLFFFDRQHLNNMRMGTKEEEEILKESLEEFKLKQVFIEPEGKHEKVKDQFEHGLKVVNGMIEIIESIKKWIRTYQPNKEQFESMIEKTKEELEGKRIDEGLLEKIIFESQKYYLFHPPRAKML